MKKRWLCCGMCCALLACGDDATADAASDAPSDAASMTDANDAANDAARDDAASDDAGRDASDASEDASEDTTFTDMTIDAPVDAPVDAPIDFGTDAALPDAGSGPVNCRPSDVLCDAPEPECPIVGGFPTVPSVVDGCYGPCVQIDRCICDGTDDCPRPDMFTCHRARTRCGPFL